MQVTCYWFKESEQVKGCKNFNLKPQLETWNLKPGTRNLKHFSWKLLNY